jgi:hypothetical protein
MFTQALNKHEEYKKNCFLKSGKYSPYEAEIGRKIGQLNWLINRARILNEKVSPGPNPNFDALYELEIITESFYYFVGRLVEIFKHNPL